jgi:hypothetical protein
MYGNVRVGGRGSVLRDSQEGIFEAEDKGNGSYPPEITVESVKE